MLLLFILLTPAVPHQQGVAVRAPDTEFQHSHGWPGVSPAVPGGQDGGREQLCSRHAGQTRRIGSFSLDRLLWTFQDAFMLSVVNKEHSKDY